MQDLVYKALPTVVGVNDNDILFVASGVENYRTFVIGALAGACDVEVHNSDNDATPDWVVAQVSRADHPDGPTYAAATTGTNLFMLRGRFRGVRIRQAGATATTITLTAYED